MDTLRGTFGSDGPNDAASLDAAPDHDTAQGAAAPSLTPLAIGQDERRMQVRAYNHWAGLLDDRMFPLIEDLDPANLPDFGPNSVLIDFTSGIEDPAVQFLGTKLAAECGASGTIQRLSDVPPRSLLSRITDHYMQILANHAPIGFEAEFVNQRGVSTLYRGILLPFSSDGETIDFLYGVINWKEIADQVAADELLLEIDQALELTADAVAEAAPDNAEPARRTPDPLTTWADSPAAERIGEAFSNITALAAATARSAADDDLPLPQFGLASLVSNADAGHGEPDFSLYALGDEPGDEEDEEDESACYNFASLADHIEAPAKRAIDPAAFVSGAEEGRSADDAQWPSLALDGAGWEPAVPEGSSDFGSERASDRSSDFGDDLPCEFASDDDLALTADALPANASLYDCLAAARELAFAAHTTEDRSRSALYAAVSRAYDFSLAARAAPEDYAELLAESGLSLQERAPMTPIVKLVFGADYDKTRLTEYAAVLSHAHRLGLARGTLAQFLTEAEGGLKGVVKAERRLRRGNPDEDSTAPGAVREVLAQKLRELEALTLEALDGGGPEFALVLIRRDEIGCAELLGELPEDAALIERAARKLVG